MNGMAKRYPWWPYVRYLVRQYPTWNNMLRTEMTGSDLRGWNSVMKAIDSTKRMENGLARLNVIRMVYWDGTHTLNGAALEIPCDRSTAARWQRKFFEDVARNRGLLD